jgi:hypothetical protein
MNVEKDFHLMTRKFLPITERAKSPYQSVVCN